MVGNHRCLAASHRNGAPSAHCVFRFLVSPPAPPSPPRAVSAVPGLTASTIPPSSPLASFVPGPCNAEPEAVAAMEDPSMSATRTVAREKRAGGLHGDEAGEASRADATGTRVQGAETGHGSMDVIDKLSGTPVGGSSPHSPSPPLGTLGKAAAVATDSTTTAAPASAAPAANASLSPFSASSLASFSSAEMMLSPGSTPVALPPPALSTRSGRRRKVIAAAPAVGGSKTSGGWAGWATIEVVLLASTERLLPRWGVG